MLMSGLQWGNSICVDAGVLCQDVLPDSRLAFLERNSMEKRGNQIKLIFTDHATTTTSCAPGCRSYPLQRCKAEACFSVCFYLTITMTDSHTWFWPGRALVSALPWSLASLSSTALSGITPWLLLGAAFQQIHFFDSNCRQSTFVQMHLAVALLQST